MCRRFNSAPRHPGRSGPEGTARRCAPAGVRNRVSLTKKKRGNGLERRPPVGTAARRAAGGSPPLSFVARRRNRVPLTEKKRGDGLERRPPAGTAARRAAGGSPPLSFTARRRNRVPLTQRKRGDGLERRPPAGTAARRAAGGSPPLSFVARRRNRVPLTQRKRGDGLERRPPVGTARERETSAEDAAPYQRECRTVSQPRVARPLTAPPIRGLAFFIPGGVRRRTRSWRFLPVGAGTAPKTRAKPRTATQSGAR